MLDTTFGADEGDLPLLHAVADLVAWPVKIRSIEPEGESRSRGFIDRITTDENGGGVTFHVTDEDGRATFNIDTTLASHVRWTCPRRRTLAVYVADELCLEIHDNSDIRVLDYLERELGDCLTEPDPMERHVRLEALRQTAVMIVGAHKGEIRRRLRALIVFLEEYAGS
jgi:hypothetical protein